MLYGVHRVGSSAADTLEVFADGARKVILQLEDHRVENAHYSPTGHIVFGIYGGDKNQIYRREMFD